MAKVRKKGAGDPGDEPLNVVTGVMIRFPAWIVDGGSKSTKKACAFIPLEALKAGRRRTPNAEALVADAAETVDERHVVTGVVVGSPLVRGDG
jgi:hypothetical protein